MNTDTIGRMMEARKYQMMAIKALFPEGKQEHIDNIERELKAMFSESMMDCMTKFMSAASDIRAYGSTGESGCAGDSGRAEASGSAGAGSDGVHSEAGKAGRKTSGSAGAKKEKVHKVTID
ncbi:MAG: hypothetical protein Q4G60_11415 [bacterium]|nr:hypothetical protein [bacterium]